VVSLLETDDTNNSLHTQHVEMIIQLGKNSFPSSPHRYQ